MSDVVVFPGSTDHIETEDINRLDGDTAHLIQGQGAWIVNSNLEDVQLSSTWAVFGDTSLRGTANISAACSFRHDVAEMAAVAAGNTYSSSCVLFVPDSDATTYDFFLRFYDDAGGTISTESINIPPTPGVPVELALSGVAGVGATKVGLIVRANGMISGQFMYVDKTCIREGTDPTFVSSLNIVGTLGETIKPPDMPIVYAADGTPLTVGEGWAGEGVEYTRYDGAVGVGPIVAQFLASDLP